MSVIIPVHKCKRCLKKIKAIIPTNTLGWHELNDLSFKTNNFYLLCPNCCKKFAEWIEDKETKI